MSARSQSPRNAPRAPAASRRGRGGSGLRPDRDGDLTMDVAVKGRGRIGKSTATPPPTPNRDLMSRVSRGGPSRGGASRSLLSEKSRSAIAKHVASNDVSMRETRPTVPRSGLAEIRITGWEKSKASGDADGGVSSLIKWMEKKASHRLGSRTREVKIKKSRVEGSAVVVSVASEDAGSLLRMNGWVWAGTAITIERTGQGDQGTAQSSQEKEDTKAMLRGVLERRYNFDTKFLDLSNLVQDEGLQSKNVFDQKSTSSKIFPALMRILELAFDTPEEKHAAVTSVSLANNDLGDISYVTTLSITLPKLLNLDLSNNKIEKLTALEPWRKRFYHLQHLILSGNPIEQNEPELPAEIMKWYPNLRMLNNVQVRTEEEVAKKSTTVTELPFPIRSPRFQDEGGIAENFIRTFFTGFDNDRTALAAHYYDDHSTFSYAVNTQAPRDPAASETTEKQEWDHYIRNSRNLKKISQLPARQSRMFRGSKAVSDAFAAMPKTKHPDLATDAKKWMIEAHIQPGVPDPASQSPGGVDGFMITIHGEFEEIDSKKRRSFDRTFIIGPGGPGGVRVVNDMLTVRAYGGAQAFDPDNFDNQADLNNQNIDPTIPQLPPGITIEMAEQMVTELQKQTGMNLQYAKDCLEAAGWDFQKGLETFQNVKANLGPEAFVQTV